MGKKSDKRKTDKLNKSFLKTVKKNKKKLKKVKKSVVKSNKNIDEHELSLAELKEAMPASYSLSVTPKLLKEVNKLIGKSNNGELLKESVLGSTEVLQEGKYRTDAYFKASIFASYKKMNYTDIKAWRLTFPDKHKRLVDNDKKQNFISATVSGYVRGGLVQRLLALSIYPTHLFYRDHYHKAVMKQVQLMNCKNLVVEQKAAGDLMKYLTPPEVQSEDELELTASGRDLMKELFNTSAQLVRQQRNAMTSGVKSPTEIVGSKLVRTTYKDKGEDDE